MTTIRVETLPATWDDARDLPFFRITARLFTSDFCFGAGVLLASYDDDIADTVQHLPADSTAVSVDAHTQPERASVPVRVRRTR